MKTKDKFAAILAFLMVAVFLYVDFFSKHSAIRAVEPPNESPLQVRATETPKEKSDTEGKSEIVEKLVIKKEISRIPPENLFQDVFDVITSEQIAGAMFKYALTPTYACKSEFHMGHDPPADGGWDVCLDVGVTSKKCIIYSFGISDDWSFDEDAVKYGCDVYSFDPTIGLSDHQRNEHHWFYNMGLWHENTERYFESKAKNGTLIKNHWVCRTVDYIRDMLKHGDRPIDMLKMDIEGTEHTVFPQMLESGILNHVKQFSFELHMGVGETKQRRWHLYQALEKLMKSYDFKLWKVHPNEAVQLKDFGAYAGMHPCCHELSWVNTNFLTPEQ
ncbi:probable methyltransferase-like protein 24 [Ptychodera flava]|uniref:probable methyltransferase-like protein 24 n=1 Tax=Ptychodera flava TaxID=63121 RepID=UPI00396A69FE